MTTLERAAVWGGLALALGLVNLRAFEKESLRKSGAVVLLELAPRDPRSLMQGDYMTLDYRIERDLATPPASEGRVVVRLDGRGLASFARFARAAETLAAGEHLLRYRRREGQPRVGPDAYFFQEGHASRYDSARYGELRVAADGDAVLIGLRDEGLAPLGR